MTVWCREEEEIYTHQHEWIWRKGAGDQHAQKACDVTFLSRCHYVTGPVQQNEFFLKCNKLNFAYVVREIERLSIKALNLTGLINNYDLSFGWKTEEFIIHVSLDLFLPEVWRFLKELKLLCRWTFFFYSPKKTWCQVSCHRIATSASSLKIQLGLVFSHKNNKASGVIKLTPHIQS